MITYKTKLVLLKSFKNLPMWPSDQSTRTPCSVEHDAGMHSMCSVARVQNLSPGASVYKFLIIPMHMMQEKRGSR